MCDTCRAVKGKPLDVALKLVGDAMEGASAKQREHLSVIVDGLLGGEDRVSDDPEAVAEYYERLNRGGD